MGVVQIGRDTLGKFEEGNNKTRLALRFLPEEWGLWGLWADRIGDGLVFRVAGIASTATTNKFRFNLSGPWFEEIPCRMPRKKNLALEAGLEPFDLLPLLGIIV